MPNIHGTLSSTGTLVGRLNQYGGGSPGTNNYEDLTNLPKINNVTLIGNKTLADIGIPTVNNATLTIQKNGTNVATFSANASVNSTANITVPTKTSDLTNDSGFITSSDVSAVAISGDYDDLLDKPTIPTATSQLTNDSGFITSAVQYDSVNEQFTQSSTVIAQFATDEEIIALYS